MTTTRPTDTPEWASAPSGGATVDEPPSGKQAMGWLNFEKPPAGAANWAWNRFADWAAHFASAGSAFATLEGAANAPAAAPLVVGDSCLVNEPDGALPGTTTVASMDSVLVNSIGSIDSGGDGVAMWGDDVPAANGRLRINERDGSGLIVELTVTTPSALAVDDRVLYDGMEAVLIHGDRTECWDVAGGGGSNWDVQPTPATNVLDVAWDDERVYVAVGNNVKALNRSTGAVLWTFNHGAAVLALATDGRRVYVHGVASGLASGATVRGIVASNGFDATGEGGLGTDAALAWDAVGISNPAPNVHSLATDGKILYVYSMTLEIRAVGDGQIAFVALGGIDANQQRIVIDHEYLLTSVYAYDRATMGRVWKFPTAGGTVAIDGAGAFSGDTRAARGNREPMRFRRVDPTAEKWLPMRQLLIPLP